MEKGSSLVYNLKQDTVSGTKEFQLQCILSILSLLDFEGKRMFANFMSRSSI